MLGAVVLLFALKYRKFLKNSAKFVTESAHEFASEYNEVYTNNDKEE